MSDLRYPKGSTERRTLVALKRGPLNVGALNLIVPDDNYMVIVALGDLLQAGMVRKLYSPIRYELTEAGEAEANR
jgi:hypothetical protein